MAILSKTQVDRLGERLKKGPPSEDDLRLLDQYRRSFGAAYETVITTVRDRLQLEPTGRPAKSTSSIVEKLRRESIRLSQVQDIAGCRIVVRDIIEQDRVLEPLKELFPGASIVDRRILPSYGYRAVHVIARLSGQLIEIQLRSTLQHLWAESSESLSDQVDPSFKYGGGDDEIRQVLLETSELVAEFETKEKEFASIDPRSPTQELRGDQMTRIRQRIMDHIFRLIFLADKLD